MFKIGDRVRTLIHLHSVYWDPDQPSIPVGELGTVDGIYHDPVTGSAWSYSVKLDADVRRLSCSMEPAEIEAAS